MDALTETPEAERTPRTLTPLRMLLREGMSYPGQLAIALAALLTTSAATIAVPASFKYIIEKAFGAGANAETINGAFRWLLLVVLILGIGTAFRFYFVSWLGERVVADIRLKVQANLLRMPPSFFEMNSPKEISSRMTSDTAVIEQVVGTTVSIALRNSITALGGMIYLFTLAPALTAGLLVGIPVVVGPIVYFGSRLRKASRSSQDRVADIGVQISEVLGAMKVVQAFGQESREAARFGEAVEHTFTAAKRRIMIRSIMTAIVIVLVFGGIAALMWQGAMAVANGSISSGTIAAFVLTGGIVAGAVGALTEVYGDLLRGAGAAGRLNELLLEQPDITAPARPTHLPQPPRGQIAFQNVSFRYPSRPEVAALEDFSLAVEPGETVAIVGPSGAGKSTLFLLAERFYDPHAGTVRIDGWSRRKAYCLPPPPATTCAMETGALATRRSGTQRQLPMPPSFCANCRKALIRFWVRMERAFRAGSASALPSHARCCVMRRSCCSTRRPARSTLKASGWCRTR